MNPIHIQQPITNLDAHAYNMPTLFPLALWRRLTTRSNVYPPMGPPTADNPQNQERLPTDRDSDDLKDQIERGVAAPATVQGKRTLRRYRIRTLKYNMTSASILANAVNPTITNSTFMIVNKVVSTSKCAIVHVRFMAHFSIVFIYQRRGCRRLTSVLL